MGPDGTQFFATPTLMRAARGAYASSIRAQLHAIGIDDLPRNGAFVLAGIDQTAGPRQDLPTGLGVTKQAVSQLIDLLVQRGYVQRDPDTDDRRRIALTLTERGREVVEAVGRGVDAVDLELEQRVSHDNVRVMRSALQALAEIKITNAETGAGRSRPVRMLRRFCPIFPVRDVGAALAHYASLGFDTSAYEEGDDYGFASRDGVGLHVEAHYHEGEPRHGASAYLYVRDPDALYAEWTRPGIGGTTEPAADRPWGTREGTHTDPDGNLIRFGSVIADDS